MLRVFNDTARYVDQVCRCFKVQRLMLFDPNMLLKSWRRLCCECMRLQEL